MSKLKKRILIVGAFFMLALIGIGNHLFQKYDAGKREPDELTQLSYSSVDERIRIGRYESEELGWTVYDEDENK